MFDILGAIGFVILVIANVIIMVVSIQLLYGSRDIRELTTEVTIAVGVDRLPREV